MSLSVECLHLEKVEPREAEAEGVLEHIADRLEVLIRGRAQLDWCDMSGDVGGGGVLTSLGLISGHLQ